MIPAELLRSLSAGHDSVFLYSAAAIRQNIAALQTCFPDGETLYSVKCNPFTDVLDTVFSAGMGADAASVGEIALAEEHGLPPERIFYSAPGKTDADLIAARGRCAIIADSLTELERLNALAAARGEIWEAGLRINPAFTMESDTGLPAKFGADEEEALPFLKAHTLPSLRVNGLHVHVKSQVLSVEKLSAYHRRVLALAARVEEAAGEPLAYVNLGSGAGIPLAPGDRPLDLAALREQTKADFAAFRAAHPATRLLLESGRYIVGNAGTFATRVIDVKRSRGQVFVLLHSTLNAFARPSLSLFAEGIAGGPAPMCEPLYSGTLVTDITAETFGREAEPETVTLAGSLCTAADIAAKDITLPALRPGDLVCFHNAGAYAASVALKGFAATQPAAEVLY